MLYLYQNRGSGKAGRYIIHQFPLRGGQLLNPVNVISKKPGSPRTKRAYFISDHGKELSILVSRGRGGHDRVLYSVVELDGFSEMEPTV